MIGIKQGISKMAVYNDKQNLKALEELKALGVNDLSPAAILEMIQQHAKMEQKQSKELNKTQKELDKTREDVKNLKEENDRLLAAMKELYVDAL